MKKKLLSLLLVGAGFYSVTSFAEEQDTRSGFGATPEEAEMSIHFMSGDDYCRVLSVRVEATGEGGSFAYKATAAVDCTGTRDPF